MSDSEDEFIGDPELEESEVRDYVNLYKNLISLILTATMKLWL